MFAIHHKPSVLISSAHFPDGNGTDTVHYLPQVLSEAVFSFLTYGKLIIFFSFLFNFLVETYCEVKDDFYAFNKIPRILFIHKARYMFSCDLLVFLVRFMKLFCMTS